MRVNFSAGDFLVYSKILEFYSRVRISTTQKSGFYQYRSPQKLFNLIHTVYNYSPVLATNASACLLLGALFGANWLRHSLPATENNIAGQSQTNQRIENSRPPEESSQPEAVRAAWRELTREAFGDHENCALHFRLKENPITMDEAAEKYGKFNKDLNRTVIASVRKIFSEKNSGKKNGEIEFLEAHSCVFEGRRFAHVVARRGDRTISILVTDTDLPDTNDNAITNQSAGTMQAASFRANHHVVFIVSDLTERETTIVAQTLAPAVHRHIERSEAGA